MKVSLSGKHIDVSTARCVQTLSLTLTLTVTLTQWTNRATGHIERTNLCQLCELNSPSPKYFNNFPEVIFFFFFPHRKTRTETVGCLPSGPICNQERDSSGCRPPTNALVAPLFRPITVCCSPVPAWMSRDLVCKGPVR